MTRVFCLYWFVMIALVSCSNGKHELEYLKDYTISEVTLIGYDSVKLSPDFLRLVAEAEEIDGPYKGIVQSVILTSKDGKDTVEIAIIAKGPIFRIDHDYYKAKDSMLVRDPNYVAVFKPKHLDPIYHEAAQQLESFFRWYLFEIYPVHGNNIDRVDVIKSPDGVWGLDVEKRIEALRESGYFHEEFLTNERHKLLQCSNAMPKIDMEYDSEGNWPQPECDFMWYYNWVGGQGENLNGFSVVDLFQDSSVIRGYIDILTEGEPFSQSIVDLKLENGNYLITDIRLK